MGGIEQIEEILKAPSSLPVVPQYERQCQDHKPLDGKAALPVQHLITVLCDAEEESPYSFKARLGKIPVQISPL